MKCVKVESNSLYDFYCNSCDCEFMIDFNDQILYYKVLLDNKERKYLRSRLKYEKMSHYTQVITCHSTIIKTIVEVNTFFNVNVSSSLDDYKNIANKLLNLKVFS